MLQPGSTRPRVPRGRAQARPGVFPLSPLSTAAFQPLPKPLGLPPYHFDLETVLPGITHTASTLGKLVFHTVGDTGGIKNADYQAAVAASMKGDLNNPDSTRPQFFFHLGDVVYYNGEANQYYPQFYEPYDHYGAPIIAIPGNHDGDPLSGQTSLDGWVRYFMTAQPHIDPVSADAPRVTLSLPNVYFTLNCPFVTIIGMYTNVPEGGSIDSIQQQWLTNEFATAPEDKALILALHHPIYSFDDHHSGSAAMADAVQHAINDSRRVPNLVLTAHVHNYQRIERQLVTTGAATPFLVAGAGGYYHLHGMTAASGHVDPALGAKLIFHDEFHHGYVTLTVDAKNIFGLMTPLASTGAKGHQSDAKTDTFKYPATLMKLPEGVTISL
ncbi:MAG: metallophosphoesterase [Acidobacteriota bacterium]|nr:metallophosphoesterase [Acidobacteriota bacterium]